MTAGRHPLALDALTDKSHEWRLLLEFDLYVDANAEAVIPRNFVSHRNRPS
jgi:hypothetical protein